MMTAYSFSFLLLVIIFCNCGIFDDSDELLFFFLILVVLFNGDGIFRGLEIQKNAKILTVLKREVAALCTLPLFIISVRLL